MLRSVSGLVAMLALVVSAEAQDTTRLQREIDALSSPPSAEEIGGLGTNSPNAYVYFLQDFLRGTGGYGGPVNGQLTTPTVRAIVAFCREGGFGETCIRGPLLPESIAAVSKAVATALVPVLPQGWRIADNGKGGSIGLTIDLISAGPNQAVLRFSGTTAREGYINVELSPLLPSTPGTWVTSVTLATEQAEGKTGGGVWLRTAVLDKYGYAGELFDGIKLPAETDAELISASGIPKEGATQLLPYVQLWVVSAGEEIDTTLTLADPTFVKQ